MNLISNYIVCVSFIRGIRGSKKESEHRDRWKLPTSNLAEISNMSLHRTHIYQVFYKKIFKYWKWRLINLIDCSIYYIFYYKLFQKHLTLFELEQFFTFFSHFHSKRHFLLFLLRRGRYCLPARRGRSLLPVRRARC